jgi:fermentation-respiration switch protein FrsA (DUF1100 family)
MLLLMAPFTSLKQLTTHLFGSLAGFLIRDRLQNEDLITLVSCPTLILHGKADSLIPWEHSKALFDRCAGPCSLMLSKQMTHDSFDFTDDLSQPLTFFLMQVQ